MTSSHNGTFPASTGLSAASPFAEFIQPNHLRPIENEPLTAILLGTGTPRAYPGAAKPAVAVLAGNKAFLVDCGADTVRQLINCGVMPHRIENVFFTHHHSDHNSGFFDFFISSWRTHVGVIEERYGPVHVYGPTNTREIIEPMHKSFSYDIGFRLTYNKSNTAGAEIVYHESDGGVVYEADGLKVTAFEVDHRPVKPCVGYKFEYGGKSLVISGDTRPVPNTVQAARGSDLLIHDAFQKDWLEAIAAENPAFSTQALNPAKYHTTTLEAAQIAQDAGVRHLVLTHHIPQPRHTAEAEAAYMTGMSDIFDGPVTVGRDLMEFRLG